MGGNDDCALSFCKAGITWLSSFPNTTTNANPVGKAKHVLSYIGLETRKLSLEEYELHHNVSFQNPSICSRLSPVRFAECIMEIVSCTSRADSFREPTFFRHIVLCGLRKVSGSCLWRLQATAAQSPTTNAVTCLHYCVIVMETYRPDAQHNLQIHLNALLRQDGDPSALWSQFLMSTPNKMATVCKQLAMWFLAGNLR